MILDNDSFFLMVLIGCGILTGLNGSIFGLHTNLLILILSFFNLESALIWGWISVSHRGIEQQYFYEQKQFVLQRQNCHIILDDRFNLVASPYNQYQESYQINPLQKMAPQTFTLSLQQVQHNLQINPIFHQLLSLNAIRQIINIRKTRFLDPIHHQQLLLIYKQYINYSFQNAGIIKSNPLSQQSHQQLIQVFQKISEQARQVGSDTNDLSMKSYSTNLDVLHILNFVLSEQNFESFINPQLDHSQKIKELFKRFKSQVFQRQSNSFAFLYLYLERCCRNQEKKKSRLKQISDHLNILLMQLQQEHPPAPPLSISKEIALFHSTWKQQPQKYIHKIPVLKLEKVSKQNKYQRVVQFIDEQIKLAYQNFENFKQLIEEPCLEGKDHLLEEHLEPQYQGKHKKRNGFGLKMGIKLKNVSDSKAFNRVIEKLFKKSSKEFQRGESAYDIYIDPTIDQSLSHQTKQYEQFLKRCIQQSDQIPFSLTDMLRAKCLFQQVDDINRCTQLLIKKIKRLSQAHKKGQTEYQLIEIDNRLISETGTSDLVLKIRINSIIAELQLAIKFKNAQNQFAHKIYQVKRSMFFEPINYICIYNEIFSKNFISKVQATLKFNNHIYSHEQQLEFYKLNNLLNLSQNLSNQSYLSTFHQLSEKWDQLLSFFNLKLGSQQVAKSIEFEQSLKPYFLPSSTTAHQFTLQYSIAYNSPQWFKFNGEFYAQLQEDKQALINLKQYANLLKIDIDNLPVRDQRSDILHQQLEHIYLKIARQFKSIKQFTESKRFYEKCLHLELKQICPKLPLFRLEEPQFNFREQISNKELARRLSGTLNNIGHLFEITLKPNLALEYYEKSRQIKTQVCLDESITTISVLNNIGLIYLRQQRYKQSLQYFAICQAIIRKSPKESQLLCEIRLTETLNNLGLAHSRLRQYRKAIQCYEQCLEILEKKKGNISLEVASVLNNLGYAYDNYSRPQEALQNYLKCLQIEKIVGKKSSVQITLANIASVYNGLGEFSVALQYYQKSLDVLMSLGEHTLQNVLEISVIYNNIGYMYDNLSQYMQALQNYYKAMGFLQQEQCYRESKNMGEICNSIGLILYKMKRYEQSLQKFDQARKIYESLQEECNEILMLVLGNIGMVYHAQSHPTKAIELYVKCIKIANKTEGQGSEKVIKYLTKIAAIEKQGGNTERASFLFEKIRCLHIEKYGQTHQLTEWIKQQLILLAHQKQSTTSMGNKIDWEPKNLRMPIKNIKQRKHPEKNDAAQQQIVSKAKQTKLRAPKKVEHFQINKILQALISSNTKPKSLIKQQEGQGSGNKNFRQKVQVSGISKKERTDCLPSKTDQVEPIQIGKKSFSILKFQQPDTIKNADSPNQHNPAAHLAGQTPIKTAEDRDEYQKNKTKQLNALYKKLKKNVPSRF